MFQRRKCHVGSHNSILHIIPNSRFFLWTGHVTAVPNQKHLHVRVRCLLVVKESCRCAFYPGAFVVLQPPSQLEITVFTLQGEITKEGGLCSTRLPALLACRVTVMKTECELFFIYSTSGLRVLLLVLYSFFFLLLIYNIFKPLEELRVQ